MRVRVRVMVRVRVRVRDRVRVRVRVSGVRSHARSVRTLMERTLRAHYALLGSVPQPTALPSWGQLPRLLADLHTSRRVAQGPIRGGRAAVRPSPRRRCRAALRQAVAHRRAAGWRAAPLPGKWTDMMSHI